MLLTILYSTIAYEVLSNFYIEWHECVIEKYVLALYRFYDHIIVLHESLWSLNDSFLVFKYCYDI